MAGYGEHHPLKLFSSDARKKLEREGLRCENHVSLFYLLCPGCFHPVNKKIWLERPDSDCLKIRNWPRLQLTESLFSVQNCLWCQLEVSDLSGHCSSLQPTSNQPGTPTCSKANLEWPAHTHSTPPFPNLHCSSRGCSINQTFNLVKRWFKFGLVGLVAFLLTSLNPARRQGPGNHYLHTCQVFGKRKGVAHLWWLLRSFPVLYSWCINLLWTRMCTVADFAFQHSIS